MPWQLLLFAVLVPALLADGLDAPALAFVALGVATVVLVRRLHRRISDLELEVKRLRAGRAAATGPARPDLAAAPPGRDFEAGVPPQRAFEVGAPQQRGPEPGPAGEAVPVAHGAALPADASAAATPGRIVSAGPAALPAAAAPPSVPRPPSAPHASASRREPREAATAVTSSIGLSLLEWFRGGNIIVRVGAVILFIGVAFLLRLAAEHALLPIELRLAAVAVGGLALWTVGWRLRDARRGYALSLQGAGIGVLYLVIFAGLRLYALLPAPLAFALLAVLSLVTALLAVRQNALPLAVLAFGGGFLAPVLTSTGQGSHVVLFSYYLVLNLAIAGVAERRAWKLLNLVGFVFTFVIATAWGLRAYHPGIYPSTQLFLALHFALYLYVCVRYSRQLAAAGDEARLRYVDGGLLFGLPIVAFGLQAGVVQHLHQGLALSSAVLSAVYLLLGRWLWQRCGPSLRLLTEGLLALGLIFLVLVTPLALDARWTGAVWAVQGAGVLWVALRQRRGWAAAIGLAMQVAAGLAFWSRPREAELAPWINAHLLGALLLGASALLSALLLRRFQADELRPWPDAPKALPDDMPYAGHWVMLGLGAVQVVRGLWDEALLVQAPVDELWRACVLLASFAVATELGQRRLRWPELGVPGRVAVGVAVLLSALAVLDDVDSAAGLYRRFFLEAGWIEGALVLGVGAWMQGRLRADDLPWRRSTGGEHLLLGWYVLLQGGLQFHGVAAHGIGAHRAWTPAALILLPTLAAWWLVRVHERSRWPAAAHPDAWRVGLLLPWLALLGAWSLAADAFAPGSMQPLPYLPLLNPIDLGHALAALYAVALWRARLLAGRTLALGLAAVGFVWLNGLLVRTLHHWAGTPMWIDGALHSGIVQTGLTILWTSLALGMMLYAARRAAPLVARGVWIAGAALLGVVVAKLFLVDLSSVGTLERIVSFLGVGVLMLVIGYVSPMPPGSRMAHARS